MHAKTIRKSSGYLLCGTVFKVAILYVPSEREPWFRVGQLFHSVDQLFSAGDSAG